MVIPLVLLGIFWQCSSAASSAASSARLRWDLTDHKHDRVKFGREDYAVTLHEGNTVYIGGTNVVYKINIVNSSEDMIPVVDQKAIDDCNKDQLDYCQNFITVLQRLDENKILVCGTNAQIPRCWHLGNDGKLSVVISEINTPLGRGVSGHTPKQRTTSLYEDQRLYSAAPLYRNGDQIVFQGYKDKKWVRTQDKWIQEPIFTNFVPLDDLIFMFFREKRVGTKNWEVDPWISRIARVCKADKGGPESDLFNKWTTFLKARLVCSLPSQNLHFNRVEDVSIDKSNMSSETRVYGIFSNRWNSTAVCVYSIGDILNVFKNSNFKGFTGKFLTIGLARVLLTVRGYHVTP
ncbi:semaphorin-7A-like [Callorhinchus milii]|uniref:semaphorin-7A-like n=1 Tax=Callorhinchus milii TaxID=7868 RepID=UPI001C3FC818|nr:semaphorin-7A-like [Callorhinchus milii]